MQVDNNDTSIHRDDPDKSPQSDNISPVDQNSIVYKDALNEVEERMSAFERSTIRWTRAAVIISTVAALFVCLQWHEMRLSSADTHDLAVAAKTLSQTASESTRIAGESLRVESAIVKGGNAARCVPHVEMTRDVLNLAFSNNGKVSAKNFCSTFLISRNELPDNRVIGQSHSFDFCTDQIVSGESVGRNFPIDGLTRKQYAKVTQGQETVVISGKFQYENGFGEVIHEPFCLSYLSIHNFDGGGSTGWAQCQDVPESLRNALPPEEQWK